MMNGNRTVFYQTENGSYFILEHRAEDGGWFYYAGFPGCLPDSEMTGPFPTIRKAAQDCALLHDEEVEKVLAAA
jgi:hypothetical protein